MTTRGSSIQLLGTLSPCIVRVVMQGRAHVQFNVLYYVIIMIGVSHFAMDSGQQFMFCCQFWARIYQFSV